MNIVLPETVTDAILTSSNIVEDDAPEWYVGETYNTEDEAIWNHHVWESLVDDNIGDRPDQGAAKEVPTWLDKGATNRYAMFDGKLQNGSANAESIEITLNSSRVIDSLVFFGLVGASLDIEVTDASETVLYSKTIPLQTGESINNWYDYFFGPFGQVSDIALIDLPNIQNLTINISINSAGSIARCAELVVGDQRFIGDTKFGMELGIRDYSRKDEDSFGNPIIVERAYAKTGTFDVSLETSQVSSVHRFLASIRATPTVFIGADYHEASIIYGFYKRFSIVIPGAVYSDCALRVEGLI